MKNKKTYQEEIQETSEIIKMMEDVFGHRVTSYSPKDTSKLKNKLSQPTDDSDKQDYVDTVEPLMNKKSIIPKKKDKFLDSFVDLDTRISQDDFKPTIDLDDYKKHTKIIGFKKKQDSDKKEEE